MNGKTFSGRNEDLKHINSMKGSQVWNINLLLFIIILNSCAVVRTPYFQTSYYKNTVDRLEKAGDSVRFSKDTLYAGLSKISLTPDDSMISGGKRKHKRIPMAGFGQAKTRFATGVHDSIFVRAVALKSGGQLSVIVSADLLLMPADVIDTLVTKLAGSGISRDQLFFSATHTHSSVGGWGHGLLARIIAGRQNEDIKKWLVNRIGEAVVEASGDLKRAIIATGCFSAPQFTINRLTHDPDQLNTDFNYLTIQRPDGSKAVVGTYSAHATTVRSKNTLLSGDYPGYWERALERSGYKVALFCGGSMANQSPSGKGEVFESAEYIGSSLADSLKRKTTGILFNEVAAKSSMLLKLELPPYHMRISKNLNFSSGVSRKLMPKPENVYLQALRINNLIWFFTPGDFSGESALLMKKILRGKGFEAAVSGYNGNYIGYILPGKYFSMKHYETRTMSWFGPFLGDYMMELMERMSNFFTQ